MYKFGRSELEILKTITEGDRTSEDISKATGIPLPTVYRNLRSLEEKDIVIRSSGRLNKFEVSQSIQARALRRFLSSPFGKRETILDSRLPILLSIFKQPKSVPRIALETCLSTETVRKYIGELKRDGVISGTSKSLHVSSTHNEMIVFLEDFSIGAARSKLHEVYEEGTLLWHDGLSFIFKAKEELGLQCIEPTGITAMKRLGLQLFSKEYEYWHSYCPGPLKNEQIALHNLLINPSSSRSIGYSLLFLRMFGFDETVLREEASYLRVNDLSIELIEFLDGNEVADPLFPTRDDFESICQQYRVG